MKKERIFFRKNWVFLLIIFVLVLVVFVVAQQNIGEVVNQQKGYHPLQQISMSNSDLRSVDQNSDGIIDFADDIVSPELCKHAEGCYPGYKSCSQIGSALSNSAQISLPLKCVSGGCALIFAKISSGSIQDFYRMEVSFYNPTSPAYSSNMPWRSWYYVNSPAGIATQPGVKGDTISVQMATFDGGKIKIYDDYSGGIPIDKLYLELTNLGTAQVATYVC